jgi:hypothetical protein
MPSSPASMPSRGARTSAAPAGPSATTVPFTVRFQVAIFVWSTQMT